MPSRNVGFRSTRSGDPVAHLLRVKNASQVTAEDLLYAGQRQRARVIERTRAGVDSEGRPFAPYSTRGPYYYNPGAAATATRSGVAGASDKSRRAAAKRMLGILQKGAPGAGGMRLSRTGRTLVFESYAAFKAWLGRSGVDLTGARAPHMLQAIETTVRGDSELVIGVYGHKADIAQGHNEGTSTLPRRRFFTPSEADLRQMVQDIGDRIAARVKSS